MTLLHRLEGYVRLSPAKIAASGSGDAAPVGAGLPRDFDWRFYVASYPDLRHITSPLAAARHFRLHGAPEQRVYSERSMRVALAAMEKSFGPLPAEFSWRDYLSSNLDLLQLGSEYLAKEHYLKFGRREGRVTVRFEPEVYHSLYFEGIDISDEALREHFLKVGRPAGASGTLEDLARADGLPHGRWLCLLRLDEFNLLNWRWAGWSVSSREALRAMVREGFDRLAPISLSQEYDPAYDAEANPKVAGSSGDRYRAWLFEGALAGRPGTSQAHLRRQGLNLSTFPEGFDWRKYGRLRVNGRNRWAMLDHVVGNAGVSASSIPVHQPGAAAFLAALAGSDKVVPAARAEALYREARRYGPLAPADEAAWAGKLAAMGRHADALALFRPLMDSGEAQLPVVLAAARAAAEAEGPRAALALLGQGRHAAAGDVRWRRAVANELEVLFLSARKEAEAFYDAGRREAADDLLTAAVAEIASAWESLDPIGIPIPAEPRRRVVMLANVDLRQCTHYRVNQKKELAAALDLDLEIYEEAEVDAFLTALPGASAAIFYRLTAKPTTIRAILACRALGIASYYDIDDLIFDSAYYPEPIETYGASVNERFYHTLQLGVPLFKAAMALCDYGIASTTCLSRFMETVVRSRQCFVLPNGLDSHNVAFLDAAPPRVRRDDDIVLFYGSGTTAHNSDFLDLVGAPLLTLMARYPRLRLMVVGFLSLDARFDAFRSRITQLGWTKDLGSYWSLLSEADINIAILAPGPTTDSKSEIKWLEAAALGVPAVVSATDRYREVLTDGVDALIADSAEKWLQALDDLIRDPERRRSIADAARGTARRRYSVESNAEHLRALLAPAFRRAAATAPKAGRKRILVFNHMFPPQTIGGSTRVVRDNIDSFLASSFAAECDFAVATTDNDNPDPYRLRVDDYRGIPVFRISVPIAPDLEWRPFDEEYGEHFARILRIWNPDLVHVHSIQRGTASVLVECIRAQVPYLNTIHDAWWVSDHQFLTDQHGRSRKPEEPIPHDPPFGHSIGESLERRRRLRILLEGSAAIIGVSDAFTALMREAGYGRAISIPNGVPPLEPAQRQRSRSGRVRLLQVSGQTHHKGYHLIQAALKSGQYENLELTVLEHGRFGGPALEATWGRTPVQFVGKTRQEDMHLLYAKHDVLLAPSVWPESFGLVSREAIAAGLWVVASDRGAVGTDVEPGVNGWVLDVSTPEALEKALEEINADPGRFLCSPPPSTLPPRTAQDQAADLIALYRDLLGRPVQRMEWPYFMRPGSSEGAVLGAGTADAQAATGVPRRRRVADRR